MRRFDFRLPNGGIQDQIESPTGQYIEYKDIEHFPVASDGLRANIERLRAEYEKGLSDGWIGRQYSRESWEKYKARAMAEHDAALGENGEDKHE